MILIVGQDGESAVVKVVDYIRFHNLNYCLINENNPVTALSLDFVSGHPTWKFDYLGGKASTAELSAYWYRRGDVYFHENFSEEFCDLSCEDINSYLLKEHSSILLAFHRALERLNISIGASTKSFTDKIRQLSVAVDSGFLVPATCMCSTKQELRNFGARYPLLATKGICGNFSVKINENYGYCAYTSLIDEHMLSLIPETFFPTLFQEYVEKRCEIRIFYLHGRCFAMAIFSQGNKQTEVDFRRYDTEQPNRTVPYQLPFEVEIKVVALMNRLGLNTGSLDVIFTPKGEYYFLEVNPDGIFSMVSLPCNYQIEREITKYLIGKNEI